MNFELPPRVVLAHLPTPLHPLPRLSVAWGGPEIWVKRDDLTGMAVSGNKVRKLEFVVAQARAEGADVLLTCGGQQSNHCRATAAVAASTNLKCHLVLTGQPPQRLEGNFFLDRLLGAEISFVDTEDLDSLNLELAKLADDYRARGHTPFIIPLGASDEIGAMGYLAAAQEIVCQCEEQNISFDAIFCTLGSGGTYTGLMLGREIFGLGSRIVGINVRCDRPYFVAEVAKILAGILKRYGYRAKARAEDIISLEDYVGLGYAKNRQEELEFIARVARLEGLLVDPVYTGKALYGLYHEIRSGRLTRGQRVLFMHTGGIFGLFPKAEEFRTEVFE
jgi:D-cysteine desulfhydrase